MLVEIGGADVNTMDVIGRNGLFYAVLYDNKEMAAYLMHLGADPLLRLGKNPTAYEMAKTTEKRDMARWLLDGAFTYQKNNGGIREELSNVIRSDYARYSTAST